MTKDLRIHLMTIYRNWNNSWELPSTLGVDIQCMIGPPLTEIETEVKVAASPTIAMIKCLQNN